MPSSFSLDPQLRHDCYVLGKINDSQLLLLDNALYPWFILVPETDATEFHKLERAQQLSLLEQINQLSRFVESHFEVSKLNTACIGNIVRQLHIHIIGRHEKDPCWPGVVWGGSEKQAYPFNEVRRIAELLQHSPGLSFQVLPLQEKPGAAQ